MPDADRAGLELPLVRVEGTWREPLPAEDAVVRFTDAACEIVWPAHRLRVAYDAIRGAAWRGDTLIVHAAEGRLALAADAGMERAWAALVARGCALPEFTRGLRALGPRRAISPEAHARFFAPLLQARRRLAEEDDLDRRVEAFRATDLRERIDRVLTEIASAAHPRSAPERRSLEAELREETQRLTVALGALGEAASAFGGAEESARFDQWRAWVNAVSHVFVEADRAWDGIARVLPPTPARRRRWPGAGAALVLAALPRLFTEVLR